MQSVKTKFSSRYYSLKLSLGIFIILVVPVWWLIGECYQDRLVLQRKGEFTSELEITRNALSHAILRRGALFEGLCAFVESDLSSDRLDYEIHALMESLNKRVEGVWAMAVAPGGVQRYIYPPELAESVMGHDIRQCEREGVRSFNERLVAARNTFFRGPFTMRDGREALLYRKAIFNGDQFWGGVSMIFDIPPVIQESGFEQASDFRLLALRAEDGTVFAGSPRLFDEDAIVLDVPLVDGRWEIAGTPVPGWERSVSGSYNTYMILSFFIAVLFTALIYFTVNRQRDLAHQVTVKTAEQKEQLEALGESEERFRSAFENANQGVCLIDLERNFIRVNQRMCQLTGYLQDELEQMGIDDITHPDDLDISPAYLERCVAGELEGAVFEKRYIHKKGSIVWGQASLSLIRDKDGRIVCFISHVQDITEKHEAIEAQHRSEEKFRLMMESFSDPLYICSTDYKIQYMNPEMVRRVGRDAVGEDCFHAIHGLDKRCDWCMMDTVQTTGKTEIQIKSPFDDRHYRVTNMPMHNQDGTLSIMSVFRDVTEMLQTLSEKDKLQAQLMQNQKMESIGNLAGGIAHDFNNILASIIGYTELALDDARDGSQLEDNLHEVYAAGTRAKDLVGLILAFARKSEDDLKPVNMGRVVEEVLHFLRSTVPANIDIQSVATGESLVMGNQTQLHQIIMNLCTNGAQAMDDFGGTLEVNLTDVEVADGLAAKLAVDSGSYVKLSVSDVGSGISPEIVDSIFEPYFTTKEMGRGTGMGLAMVLGIVQSYGGAIVVDTVVDEGSTFTIYLPAAVQDDRGNSLGRDELPKGSERILLVDDEVPVLKMGRQSLESLGYRVTTQSSSIEALDLFLEKPDAFDLVVTDMTMPEMTGDLLAVAVMVERPEIPVIICTGYSSKMSQEKASELGVRGYLEKPFERASLARAVRDVLDKGSQVG